MTDVRVDTTYLVYPYIRQSVRMQQRYSYRTEFLEISYLGFLLQFFDTS